VSIPNRPSYVGCKSWVNLTDPVSTEGAAEVLSPAAFDEKRSNLLKSLQLQ
jgi:Uncharacterized protein conserved in bacteria